MTTPPAIEDCHRRIGPIETEMGILERESSHRRKFQRAARELWPRKKPQVESSAGGARKKMERGEDSGSKSCAGFERNSRRMRRQAKKAGNGKTDGQLSPDEVKRVQGEIARLNDELGKIQGDSPLMQVCVDAQAVAEVVSGWTGIPVGKVMKDEIQTVLSLKDRLEERVIGQSHALEAISQRIRTARAKLEDPRRPIGVFMLVGPSGVGKTETALALADTLFGGERNVVIINMSEYQEAHTVSGLKGSPPGYVGYGEGGVLTEAVRRKPYSVVLLDEMEKAHTDVMELFYQVFDKGMLEDGEGREIDFKNTLIIMTSNAGTDTIMKLCADPDTKPEPERAR